MPRSSDRGKSKDETPRERGKWGGQYSQDLLAATQVEAHIPRGAVSGDDGVMGAPCKLLEVLFRKSPHRGRWGASGPGLGSQVVAHVSPRSEPSQHHSDLYAADASILDGDVYIRCANS